MTYELPPLPYPYDALEPYIDAQTLELHHGRHHAAYVHHLNQALEQCKDLANLSLEEILYDIRVVPEDLRQEVRNNGGGHLNHSLLWHTLSPSPPAEPTGQLLHAIESTFGQLSKFQEELTNLGLSRFGSGWAWLCVDTHGRLEALSTPNQDSPIMLGYRPVLGLDLWEHAYYLKYHNRRDEYIEAFWHVVNWRRVAELYAHCLEIVAKT